MEHFPQVFAALSRMFEQAVFPAALCDGQLQVAWANQAGIAAYPTLSMPDGIALLLPASQSQGIRGLARPQQVCVPLVGAQVTACFFPVEEEGYLVLFYPGEVPGASPDYENQVRAISSFSSQMRGPLSAMFSIISSMYQCRDFSEMEEAPRLIRALNTQCYELLRTVTNFFSYLKYLTGVEAASPRRVEIGQFLRSLLDACAFEISSIGVPLRYNLPEYPLQMVVDTNALTMCLLQLISNSCRYTREGNHIEVTAREMEGKLFISVADWGAGIPAHLLSRVREPFFSYDRERGPYASNGLGLTLVQFAVAQMGGSFAILSQEDVQTTVSIRLPICTELEGEETELHSGEQLSAADYVRNRFSMLHILLSNSCGAPEP